MAHVDRARFSSLVIQKRRRRDQPGTGITHVEGALTTVWVAPRSSERRSWTCSASSRCISLIDDDTARTIPAVLMIAMFIQSFTESRFCFKGNWMLFVVNRHVGPG